MATNRKTFYSGLSDVGGTFYSAIAQHLPTSAEGTTHPCPTPDIGFGVGSHDCPDKNGGSVASYDFDLTGLTAAADAATAFVGYAPGAWMPSYVTLAVHGILRYHEGTSGCPLVPSFDCNPFDTGLGHWDVTAAGGSGYIPWGTTEEYYNIFETLAAAVVYQPSALVTNGFGEGLFDLPGASDGVHPQYSTFIHRPLDGDTWDGDPENLAADLLWPWDEVMADPTAAVTLGWTLGDVYSCSDERGVGDPSPPGSGFTSLFVIATPYWRPFVAPSGGWMCVL